jgi:hypothetical protein
MREYQHQEVRKKERIKEGKKERKKEGGRKRERWALHGALQHV